MTYGEHCSEAEKRTGPKKSSGSDRFPAHSTGNSTRARLTDGTANDFRPTHGGFRISKRRGPRRRVLLCVYARRVNRPRRNREGPTGEISRFIPQIYHARILLKGPRTISGPTLLLV